MEAEVNIVHRYTTATKYMQIYDDFRQLRKDTYSKYPELRGNIKDRYFYGIIADRHNRSFNYIVTIINKVDSDRDYYESIIAKKRGVEFDD